MTSELTRLRALARALYALAEHHAAQAARLTRTPCRRNAGDHAVRALEAEAALYRLSALCVIEARATLRAAAQRRRDYVRRLALEWPSSGR